MCSSLLSGDIAWGKRISQFNRPFVVESTAIAEAFGLKPEPLADALSKVTQYIPD